MKKELLLSVFIQGMLLLLIFTLYKMISHFYGKEALYVYAISRRDILFFHSIISLGTYYAVFNLSIKWRRVSRKIFFSALLIVVLSSITIFIVFFYKQNLLRELIDRQPLDKDVLLFIISSASIFAFFNIVYYYWRAHGYWFKAILYEFLIKGLLPVLSVLMSYLVNLNFNSVLILIILSQMFLLMLIFGGRFVILFVNYLKKLPVSYEREYLLKVFSFGVQRIPFDFGYNLLLLFPLTGDVPLKGIVAILFTFFSAANYIISIISMVYIRKFVLNLYEVKKIFVIIGLSATLISFFLFLFSEAAIRFFLSEFLPRKEIIKLTLTFAFLFLYNGAKYVLDAISFAGFNSVIVWVVILLHFLLVSSKIVNCTIDAFLFSVIFMAIVSWLLIFLLIRLKYEEGYNES